MVKKLIEVALPLEAINKEAAREKSIRHGHPSTLHLWWARRPLAACRAVLFSSLVDDPSSHPEQFPTEEAQDKERQRLFRIIEELVKWENSNNETVLNAARAEILKSTNGHPPPVLDPFCGGGSIPLEAQRLGLEAHASDLNPVAVLITKALIEIPPKFAGRPPVNPESRKKLDHSKTWRGAQGLAEDVRYYGQWMRDEAEKRIGHLYPKVKLPKEQGGGEATVIAWLWARTVKCPNPACGAQMPLVRSFWLSTRTGKKAWVEPVVDKRNGTVRFEVRFGNPDEMTGTAIGLGSGFLNENGKKVKATFKCVACDNGIAKGDYIDAEASEKRLRSMPLAVVAEGKNGRIYLPFDDYQLRAALEEPRDMLSRPAVHSRIPTEPARGTFASNAQGRIYGFKTFADYFTARQLVALTTLSGLVGEARERVLADLPVGQASARKAGMPDDGRPLNEGGSGATAYADAVATYLGLGLSRTSNTICSLAVWSQSRDQSVNVFSRQGLPMNWDFPEVNPFAGAAGDFAETTGSLAKTVALTAATTASRVMQLDAATSDAFPSGCTIATDPPYYDNIGYADLSDFFYVWLRRSLAKVYPDIFSTLLTPKAQELERF